MQTLHGIDLVNLVRLTSAAVIHSRNQDGGWRGQASLSQPALQGARGGNVFGGMAVEQGEAETSGAPGGMETAQLQARVTHGNTRGVEGASAAVEGRREIGSRQRTPTGQQMANGADGQGQLLSDVRRGKASLVQLKELLTQV
jgi:hypothetical protein